MNLAVDVMYDADHELAIAEKYPYIRIANSYAPGIYGPNVVWAKPNAKKLANGQIWGYFSAIWYETSYFECACLKII